MVMRPIHTREELNKLIPTGNVRYCIIAYTKDYEGMGYDKEMVREFTSEKERNSEYTKLTEKRTGSFMKYDTEEYLIIA